MPQQSKSRAVPGRARSTETPPRAFASIHDAWIEKQTCGKFRYVYHLGDLFCVARSPAQAIDAYFEAKGIDPTCPLTNKEVRELMDEAGEMPESEPVFPNTFAD